MESYAKDIAAGNEMLLQQPMLFIQYIALYVTLSEDTLALSSTYCDNILVIACLNYCPVILDGLWLF